jgi:glycosyltransferase involved in cell wall biosynthesis
VLSHILIYDNSEKRHQSKLTDSVSGVTYFHNPQNGGTVAAYSYALELAKVIGANWLLLLDHDTAIPLNHLILAADELNNTYDSNVAALVPVVKHGDTTVSPAFLNKYGSVVPSEDINNKKITDICTAISSGVFINTEALNDIMPFPKELWLDYVDHWMFLSFFRSKWNVLSFKSIIDHHLSIEVPSELGARRLTSISI